MPAQRDDLPLSDAEIDAVFTDICLIAVRHSADKHIRTDRRCRSHHRFIRRIQPPVTYIFRADTAGKRNVSCKTMPSCCRKLACVMPRKS